MLKPLGDRILIKMRKAEEVSKGGIILSTKTKELSQIAEVIEVGTGKVINGKLQPIPLKKGDNIIVRKFAGTEIRYEGKDYIIIRQDDILATF